MRKYLVPTLTIMMVMLISLVFISCSKDKDDVSGGLTGWYTDLSYVAKQSDFDEINKAIRNNEELSSYRYNTYVASKDLFLYDGMYNDSNSHFGRLRFSIHTPINAVRIVDDQTLIFYVAWLYEDGASSDDIVYKLYAGPIFGNMNYCGNGSYYSYVKVENKLVVSNGDIYTIVDGGLILEGSTTKWNKYDPNKRN